MCDCNFPSLVAYLFSWRCLAASSSSSLHAAMNLRPPSVTASTQTSAFNAIAFQSPVMPNARMSLCTQSVHSFPFPPRPIGTAPSRFPNMIRFGNRPPLIRRSVPAHKNLSCADIDQAGNAANPVRGRLNIFPCPRSSLRIWSRTTGSTVPPRASLLVLHTQAESGAYSRGSSRFPRRRSFIHRHLPLGQSRVYQVSCVPMAFTAENPPAQGQ